MDPYINDYLLTNINIITVSNTCAFFSLAVSAVAEK